VEALPLAAPVPGALTHHEESIQQMERKKERKKEECVKMKNGRKKIPFFCIFCGFGFIKEEEEEEMVNPQLHLFFFSL